MPAIQLHTKNLLLRPVKRSDLEATHALHSLPETDRYNTQGIPANIGVTEKILKSLLADNRKKKREAYYFAAELAGEKKFMGMVAIRLSAPKYKSAEIWYKFHSAYWGKGYATEAAQELIAFGFNTLKLHRIEAGCATGNKGSAKVLEKAGMALEGTKKLALPLKSGWSDCFEYAIVNPNE